MRRIVQRFKTDCGIACVAMIAGVPYHRAFDALGFTKSMPNFFTDTDGVRIVLEEFGLRVAPRMLRIPNNRKDYVRIGSSGILASAMRKNGVNHWLVYDHLRDRILDPRDPPYSDRLRLTSILKVWRD